MTWKAVLCTAACVSAALLPASVGTAGAEVFTWTDDAGVVHFTDRYNRIPVKYLEQNRDRQEEVIDPAALFRGRCSACHALPRPESELSNSWEVLVEEMEVEMKKSGMTPMTVKEKSMLLDYLKARSMDAR